MSGELRSSRRLRACAAATTLLLGTTTATAVAAPAFQTPRLYVTNSTGGTLSGVDPTSGAVRSRIYLDQPRGVGNFPLLMKTSKNGRVVYALCDGADEGLPGTLIAIDAVTKKVVGTAPVGWNANDFVFSPDGKYAYVTGIRNIYKVNLSTMHVVATLPDGSLPTGPQLTADGSTLYVANAYGSDVLAVDTATLTVRNSYPVSTNQTASALSADGTELYVLDTARRLSVLDLATGTVTGTVSVAANMNTLTMSPDGQKLYVSGYGVGEIDVVKTSTNKFNKKIVARAANGVFFSKDGSTAYAASGTGFYTIDTASGTITSTLAVQSSVEGMGLSPDGSQAWIVEQNNTAVVDLAKGTVVKNFDTPDARTVGFTSAPGAAFVGMYGSNTVAEFNDHSLTQTASLPCEFREPEAVGITPDGSTAYVSSGIGSTIRAVDLVTGKPTADITAGDGVNSIAMTPDGRSAIVADSFENSLSVIDTATNKVVRTVPLPVQPAEVKISPDGSTAYVIGWNYLTYVSLSTFEVTGSVQLPGYQITGSLALSPDGTTAYLGYSTGFDVIDLASKTITHSYTGIDANSLYGLVVSPDGTKLYASAPGGFEANGSLDTIDTATGAVTATVALNLAPTGVAMSPDGSALYVAGGQSNTVQVVNTQTDTVTATWTMGTGDLETPLDGIVYSEH